MLPRWLSGKESACSVPDVGLIPGSGRSPGKGNGNPLQYSCLEIPWTEATRPSVPQKSDITQQLNSGGSSNRKSTKNSPFVFLNIN